MTYDPQPFQALPENDESQGQGQEGEGQEGQEQFVVENGRKIPQSKSQGWRDGQREKRRSIEEVRSRRVLDRKLEGKRGIVGSMTQSMTGRIGEDGGGGADDNISPLDENEEWAKV